MLNPALEWLFGRLKRGPATPQEVEDEATVLKITPEELESARRVLGVALETVRASSGDYVYDVWALPPNAKWPPTPLQLAAEALRTPAPAIKSAEVVPTTAGTTEKSPKSGKKLDPKAEVEKARRALQRNSPRMARYLRQLAEEASEDAVRCPTCGRGTPRSEEVRLKAILAALDRSGVQPPRTAGDAGGDTGPAIVFPPGTRIAIMADSPQPLPTLTRADQYEAEP